jgi:hypothetical protein
VVSAQRSSTTINLPNLQIGQQCGSSMLVALSRESREMGAEAASKARHCSSLRSRCCLGTPATWAALEHVAMMQQTVEHGADCGDIAEQLAPVFDRAV